jgi:DNA mismatch repair protein MSH4
MATPRPSTSYSYASTSYQNGYTTSTSQAPDLLRPGTARPSSGRRSRASSTLGGESQQIICAVNESRGVSPTVGLSFVNITTGEAVLSQICDNQFYARTLNKLQVFEPTIILIISTCGPPNPSKMYLVIEENIIGARIIMVDRKYWIESVGLEFIQQLAFVEDVEALKVAVEGNFFATCCFAAVSPLNMLYRWC